MEVYVPRDSFLFMFLFIFLFYLSISAFIIPQITLRASRHASDSLRDFPMYNKGSPSKQPLF